jgi:hypothetical protein
VSTLSKNQIVVEYVVQDDDVKKVVGGMNTLTAKEKEALTELRKYNDQLKKTGSEGGKAVDQVSGKFGNMNSTVGNLGKTIAGVFAVTTIIAFGKSVFDTTSRFEKLGSVLKNTLGSGSAAALAIENIKNFAKTTPFSVEELTASFVKLANQGFRPTTDQMRKLGDLASSTGKSFDQLSEAIIDAQVGEFERLKEFGVRAEKAGDQVRFTFKGVQTQVDFTNEAIRQYLVSLGDYEGVAGAAAAISDTLGGKVNNLGDAWDNFLNKIGTLLKPILTEALNVTADFMDQINGLFGGVKSDAERFLSTELQTYQAYQESVISMTDDELQNFVTKQKSALKESQAELKKNREELKKWDKASLLAASVGFGQTQIIDAQKAAEKANQDIAAAKGRIAAAQEQIKMRTDATFKTEQQYLALEIQKAKEKQKTNEELENEYKAKVQLLELDKKIAALRIQLRTEEGFERNLALLRNDVEYGEKRLAIDREYAAQSVQDAKDNARIQGLINQTKSKEIIATIKAEAEARRKEVQAAKDGIREIQNEQIKFENKKRTDAEESVERQKKLNQELLDLEKEKEEAFKRIDKNREEEEKEAKKKKDELTIQEWEAYSMVASATLDNVMNLYQTNIDRQMNALNKKYAAEIRLADGNAQKIMELDEKKAAEEKKLREKEFRAQQLAAVAQVIFKTAPVIAEYFVSGVLAPLAVAGLAIQASQIAFIMAQPVPEFREGTKGKAYQGKAIVGEEGSELVVTQSGKVYKTPSTASLVNLSEKSHVIPAPLTEKILSGKYEVNSSADYLPGQIVARLESIEGTLRGLPFTNVQIDREGFFVYQEQRAAKTKRLNSKFKSPMLR